LVEPPRACGKDLHLTTVRNEHAYFCCISQLMEYHSLPFKSHRPIYVIGDSHCMSLGWHHIEVAGEMRTLHPKLVTGLKMWHLRPESRFYPKVNFYNVVKTIPKGAQVVFLFGEIDCREGLVVSVDKCRYKDITEGALVTIDIYIDVLKKLKEELKFDIYIHPIVPVLNETRHIVKQFNQLLKPKIEENEPTFYWLDFFEGLLSSEGGLNKNYEFDGTHLSPKYIPLLTNALNKVITK